MRGSIPYSEHCTDIIFPFPCSTSQDKSVLEYSRASWRWLIPPEQVQLDFTCIDTCTDMKNHILQTRPLYLLVIYIICLAYVAFSEDSKLCLVLQRLLSHYRPLVFTFVCWFVLYNICLYSVCLICSLFVYCLFMPGYTLWFWLKSNTQNNLLFLKYFVHI